MTTSYDLIPCPRELTKHDGVFPCGAAPRAACLRGIGAEDAGRLLAAARQVIPDLARTESPSAALVLEIDPALAFPAAARPDVLDQGYALEVTPGGIRARARSARGLYYALRTLGQLPRAGAGIPACAIRDWPDLPFRCLHMPGFGNIPRYDALLKLIETIAGWKYTALLIEYDDRFAFERYPVLNHPAAFSKAQLRDLIAFAAERFIEVVPCLDSLGHANFYLMHKEFQHLAELPGNIWELCPSNPETLVFIKNLWTEVLEVHRGARFAAITGDEVFREGGFCPACGDYAKTGRLSDLYTTYYGDLSRWVLAQGVRPMMWGDMILTHPEAIGRLPREVVFGDWNYSGHAAGTDGRTLYVRGAGEFRPGDEQQIPERYARVFGKYFKSTDGRAPFEPFPYLRYFQDQGFDVLATTITNGPAFRVPVANNRQFCRAASKASAFGLLATTWESYLPIQNAWHGMAAGGGYAWNAEDAPEPEFLERLMRIEFGGDLTLASAADAMDRLLHMARGFAPAPRSGDLEALREGARTLRSRASAAPREQGKVYAELSALRMDKASRAAALHETVALRARLDLAAGDDKPLDISSALNWDGVMPRRSGVFDPAPGRRDIWGIPFEIADPARHGGRRGLCVGGRESLVGATHGAAARLLVGRSCDALFFLVAGAWGALGARDGILRMQRADGSKDDLPLVPGRNILDWSSGDRAGAVLLENAVRAWEGSKAFDGGGAYRFGLYLCAWHNPRPADPLETVELVPPDEGPGFAMLFGITARAAGSTRPAPDAERLKARAAALLAAMERMAAETDDLVARHRALYARLLAPEDADRQMQGLNISDLGPAIAALRAAC